MSGSVKLQVLPPDYEECGEYGFDHEYSPEEAYRAHMKLDPCQECKATEDRSLPILPSSQILLEEKSNAYSMSNLVPVMSSLSQTHS